MSELRFHPMHGANVDLSEDGQIAHHLPRYGKGLVFGSRPVGVGERVAIKFLRLSNTVCFGFTAEDPNRLSVEDLQSSYRDLLTRSDYWIWPLFKNMCVEDTVLFYYVSEEGEVHFGIDGREIDSFYKKVNIELPLWAVFDIDGDFTTVQLVPPPETEAYPEPPVIYQQVEEEEEEEEPQKIAEEDLCVLCYQKEINSVLYKCGHMCMCIECAMKQKHGAGNGQCPFCRAEIKDVIRTYK